MARVDTNRNLVAALAYVPFLAVILSIVIFVVEKDDKFIRFHSLQSFVISLAYYVVIFILDNLPLGGIFNGLVSLAAILIWLISMVKAYQGQLFKWPFAGNFAEKHIK